MARKCNLFDKEVHKYYKTGGTNESIFSTNIYFNNIRFVQNLNTRGSEQNITFISIDDFFYALQKEENLYFVNVTLDEDTIWDERIIQDKINIIKRPLIIELCSSGSTKVYIKYPDKQKIIIIDLNSPPEQMTKDDLLIKIKGKDSFGIHLIIEALKQGLIGHFNDKAEYPRSLTDVTFVINEPSHEEGDCISLDYTLFHNDILSSCWLSIHVYNTLYDAIRSNNVHFFDTLNEKCKDDYVMEIFNNILTEVYDEISIRSVPLIKEIKYVIEEKIINFSFFIDKTKVNKQEIVVSLDDICRRISIISDGLVDLQRKCFSTERKCVDGEFIYIAKFIAQNIHILKYQLKITYDRLPWEEMEFCLISFISSNTKDKFFNFVFRIVLDQKKIINYLEKFIKELNKFRNEIKVNDLNKKFPKQINKSQLASTFGIYDDYYLIKNIYSLERIDHYVTLALEIDLDEEVEIGKLVIERVLQVIGESLKNTLESLNLSDDIHNLLIYSAPKNLKDIVTSLRDSLSHFHTLQKKTEFEECKNIDYFKKIQNDLKKIKNGINHIFFEKRKEIVKIILNKIIECDDLQEVKELLNIVNEAKLEDIKINDGNINELIKIKKLIETLRNEVKNKTEEEKNWFRKIDKIIISQENEFENDELNNFDELSLIGKYRNSNNLTFIQKRCRYYLKVTKIFIQPNKLKEILGLISYIKSSVESREQYTYEIKMLISTINWTFQHDVKEIHKINKFKNILQKKEADTESKAKNTIESIFDEIIKQLQKNSELDSETFSEALLARQKSYQENKRLPKIKKEMILIFDKLEKQEILKSDSLVQSTFTKLDKLVNNKPLQKMFTDGKWRDCKKKLETLVTRDTYETLFNSVKNYIKDEKYDMSLCFQEFVSSFKDLKVKNTLIKYVHGIIDTIFKEQIQIFFDERFKLLKELLSFFINYKNSLQKYMKDEKLQSAVEMLVLDLTEILESDGRFGDNKLSLERCSPVLIGKTLRNYLAHGDPLIDILPCDPSTEILSNALRFIKEGNDLFLNEKRLIGQRIVGNLSDLANQYRQGLDLVTNQNDMFLAAKEGNLQKMKYHINKGADIKGRDYKGWSGLHFAAQGNNIEIFDFILNRNVSPYMEDIAGKTCFHIAATFGSNVIIKYLLEKGADVNYVTKDYWTPLHLATNYGHIDIVRTLLENKANINDETMDGRTALELAIRNNHTNIVKYLKENGATGDIDELSEYYATPLHLAVYGGNIIEVENILKNVEGDQKIIILETKDIYGRTPLYLAIRDHHAFSDNNDIVSVLLKEGADVNTKNVDDSTPLHEATVYDHVELVEKLIEYGANINCLNKYKQSALDLASSFGNEKVVDILLQNNASVLPQNRNGNTALHIAAMCGYVKVMEILLKKSVDVDVINKRSKTALHLAASFGYTDIIDLLLDKNANVNALDEEGCTPLYYASDTGKIDVIEQLLERGAIIDIPNKNGLTVLDFAKSNGYKDIITLLSNEKYKVNFLKNKDGILLELTHDKFRSTFLHAIKMNDEEEVKTFLDKGAKDDILDENGSRPLHWAAQLGHINIVKLLLKRKAEYNVEDNDGETPLHHAVFSGHKRVAELLLIEGANINVRGNNGYASLHYAAHKGDKYMVELLLEKGAHFEIKDNKGWTPLHFGAGFGGESVVERLLKKGANVRAQDNEGRTPVYYGKDLRVVERFQKQML